MARSLPSRGSRSAAPWVAALAFVPLAWTTPSASALAGETGASSPQRVRYDGHRVVRAWPSDETELDTLLELADDVWTERVGVGPVDVRLSPASLAALDATGIDYDLRIADVQLAVDAEAARIAAAPTPTSAPAWFSEFRDYDAIDGYLDELAAEFPDLLTIENVGSSLEGRAIRGMKMTAGSSSGKAGVMMTAMIHAREWLSPMTVMCIADTLMRERSDPRIAAVLDSLVVYVVPVQNPDGYVYSWSGDRYWRKNVRGGYGVDLNRNWAYEWGGPGSSGSTFDENYRGDAPFSEPESTAVSQYMASKDELVASVDFHSFASLILYPWGYQYGAAPDSAQLSMIAGDMSAGMQGSTGHYFDPIQGSELYPASGVVDDYAYGELGLMAFTIELRGSDFVIAPSQIAPSCDENLEAILRLAEWAYQFSDPDAGGDDAGDDAGGTGGGDDAGDHGGHTSGPGDGGHTSGPGVGDDDDDDDGEAGDGAEGEGDGAEGEGDDAGGDGGGAGAAEAGALPAAYGFGGEDGACACRSGGGRDLGTALGGMLLVLGLRRRRG